MRPFVDENLESLGSFRDFRVSVVVGVLQWRRPAGFGVWLCVRFGKEFHCVVRREYTESSLCLGLVDGIVVGTIVPEKV